MSVAAPPQELATNPLREGLDQERVPDASCLVIFGASGDLTQRKLIPALYSLAHDGLLPAGQTIIGFARPDYTDEAFRMACASRATSSPARGPSMKRCGTILPMHSSTSRANSATRR